MPTPKIPAGSLDALNDNELEILHLLANGHTAKSIAARLGRSETAINERLRDARRKTGVGSSRELARLLDAQKIWDKNIDLEKRGSSNENLKQPRSEGALWSKGRIIMLFALPVAALGFALAISSSTLGERAAPTAEAASLKQSPLVGSWSLDTNRVPAEERPQSVTIVFEVSRDQTWTTNVEIIASDGSIARARSIAALDGVPIPVTGNMTFIDSVSLRQPAANTLVMTLGKDGVPVSTRVYTVAKDGKSMTETIIWPGSEIPKMETTYFNRIG